MTPPEADSEPLPPKVGGRGFRTPCRPDHGGARESKYDGAGPQRQTPGRCTFADRRPVPRLGRGHKKRPGTKLVTRGLTRRRVRTAEALAKEAGIPRRQVERALRVQNVASRLLRVGVSAVQFAIKALTIDPAVASGVARGGDTSGI